jgi:type II secretory pathway pseudopilin PulG
MKRSAFSVVELLIVILIVATLMALILPAVWKVRQASDRTQNTCNLLILTGGMHSLNDVHKRLPPATGEFGDPAFNATFHIHLMPFIEQDNLYKAIVAGTPPNPKTVALINFVSPLDFTQINDGAGVTTYAANLRVFSDLGYKTAWDSKIVPDGNGNDPETGKPWYFGTAAIPKSFRDGTSNTIALVTQYSRCGTEGRLRYFTNSAGMTNNSPFFGYYAPDLEADADRGIKNGRPGVIFQILPTQDDCNPSYTPQSFLEAGIVLSWFDGSARLVSPTISKKTWGCAVQPNDGIPLGQDWIQ